jgi:hypothetical protein
MTAELERWERGYLQRAEHEREMSRAQLERATTTYLRLLADEAARAGHRQGRLHP